MNIMRTRINTARADRRLQRLCRQRGMSLVEIMVAMLISLFLLGGVIQIFLGSKQSYTVNEGMSRLQENARFAFDRINQDLSAGGYTGCNDSASTTIDGSLLVSNTLTINNTTAYDFANAIDGTNNGGLNGSDTLSIRRAVTATSVPLAGAMTNPWDPILLDSTHPNYAALQQWEIMALSDCYATAVFMITNDPATSGGVIQHAPGVVSPAGEPNTGQSNAGSLDPDGNTVHNLEFAFGSPEASVATSQQIATTTYSIITSDSGTGTSLAINGVELVEGVQDLQVEYGLDADGTPGVERYVEAGNAALTNLNQVASVRVTLQMAGLGNDGNIVQVGGQPLTKVFTQTFRLRNR
ncbi:MAG: PilW family protein [Thiogranum sp.]|nr:PilW family protein [Thiogranum sp.]